MNARDMDPDRLRDEALVVLDVIAGEFKTDPQSVACFDLRTVQKAIAISDEYQRRQRNIESMWPSRRR